MTGEGLNGGQRQDRAAVDEAVARVVEAGDREALPFDRQHVARSEPERPGGAVAEHRLASARAAALDDHEPAGRELVRGVAEDEERVALRDLRHAQEDARHVGDAVRIGDRLLGRLRQQRAREVGRVRLEDAEVRAPDVDQVARRLADAGGDREQRDDQPDAERDAGRGQRSSRRPPQEVLPDEPDPRHVPIFHDRHGGYPPGDGGLPQRGARGARARDRSRARTARDGARHGAGRRDRRRRRLGDDRAHDRRLPAPLELLGPGRRARRARSPASSARASAST